jgi:hypothetical protein
MAKKISINQQMPQIPSGDIQLNNEKKPLRCRILIVCEGAKTEPLYFKSFNTIKTSNSWVVEIETGGGGINTIQVVDEAIQLKEEAEKQDNPYDSVWAVFDRDSFKPSDFNTAILKAEKKGIGCAWSNEAFELWYVYYFDNRCTGMQRSAYKEIITQRVRKTGYQNGKKKYTYSKNDPNMRSMLLKCGCDEKKAIKRAESQANTFQDQKFHLHNPCTMVYKLVKQLVGEDKDLVKLIKRKLAEK